MDVDTRSSKLKGIIEPEHLLNAIEKSLEHSDETVHSVTGLTFKTVHNHRPQENGTQLVRRMPV